MRFSRIKKKIEAHIQPIFQFDLEDESHRHAGRQGQESHFKIFLVSDYFKELSRVQRQRQINDLLSDEFQQGLHALSLRLLTVKEYQEHSSDFQSPLCSGKNKG